MRRACTCAAVLGLAVLTLPGLASATPTVTVKGEAVPIPGFPHTGDILGAGTDVTVEYSIAGTEYFGSPPPIIGNRFYAPKGTVLDTSGFPTCAEEVIVNIGPSGCPKGSSAGHGTALGYVTFGGERVEEIVELFVFFKPGGGIEFFADGHSPALIELLARGRFSHMGGANGYGFEEEDEVPLVASVPGAPYASVKTITATFGAAIKSHGKTIYFGRVPKTCPKGGFPLKNEVIFAENGEPSKPEPVTTFYKAPCPRREAEDLRPRTA
jgi:hypothetical protein